MHPTAKAYRYVRTGADHYSLAFTYDCIAWSRDSCVTGRCYAGGPEDALDPDNLLFAKF